jgi:hypothetical protein
VHVGGKTMGGRSETVAVGNHGGHGLNGRCTVESLMIGPTWFRYFLNEFHSFLNFGIQNICLHIFQKNTQSNFFNWVDFKFPTEFKL